MDSEPRDDQARRAAEHREQRALGEQQAHDAGTAGAERETHCNLSLPRVAATQQEVGDVHAGDEEHEGNRRGQHQQGLSDDRRHTHDVERPRNGRPRKSDREVVGIDLAHLLSEERDRGMQPRVAYARLSPRHHE